MHKIFLSDKKSTFLIFFLLIIISAISVSSIYIQFEAFKELFSDNENKIVKYLIFQSASFLLQILNQIFFPLIKIIIEKQNTKIIINNKNRLTIIIGKYTPRKFNSIGSSEYINDLEKNANLYFGNYIKNFYYIFYSLSNFILLTVFVILQAILYSVWVLLILGLILVFLFITYFIPNIFAYKNKENRKKNIDITNKELSNMSSIIEGYKYFYSHDKIDNFKNKLLNSLNTIEYSVYNIIKKRLLFDFFEESLTALTHNLLYISTISLTLLNPINKFLILVLDPIINNLKFSASNAISKIKDIKISQPLKDNFDKYDIENKQDNLKNINDINNIKIKNFNIVFDKETNKNLYEKNININFQKNMKYYILGKSGSGKSTLVKSILKEVFVTNGNIKINDILVEQLNQSNIYNDLILVENKQISFEGTAKEIITFYSKNINEHKLNEAIKKSFINFDIGRQYDTLSAGEKQRVKLAWCFYYDKKVIIFDEALSNIDYKTSEQIEKNILNLKGIFINISHYPNETNLSRYNLIINLDEQNNY